jgi:hypothetical protein
MEKQDKNLLEQRELFQNMHKKSLQEIRYRHNRAIEYARQKLGMYWENNHQRLSFYEYFEESLSKEPIDLL